MTWYRVGPAGIPGSLKTDMDAVLNKKFGTSTTYAPNTWPDNVNLLGPLPERTASGAIAHIEDGADGVPLKNWLVTLPASLDGYTEVNGTKSGANLFPFPIADYWETGDINATTGETEPNANNTRTKDFLPVSATTIYVSGITNSGSSDKFRFFFYASDKSFISRTNYSNTESVTVPSNAVWFKMRYQTASGSFSNPSIFEQADQSYQPYTKTTYAASLGRTIYGGTADIVTGEGSNGSILIDLSELTWNMDNDTRFRSRQTDYTGASGWSGDWQNTVSNRFVCENPATAFGNRSDYSFANIPQNYYNFDIKVPTGIFQDATEFKAWLANVDGNGTHAVVVIDRLTAEPFTFTPITADTELGTNNFWADEGDSDVTYRADIDLALNA